MKYEDIKVGETYMGSDYAFTVDKVVGGAGALHGSYVTVGGYRRVGAAVAAFSVQPVDAAIWYIWPDGVPERWAHMTPHDTSVLMFDDNWEVGDPQTDPWCNARRRGRAPDDEVEAWLDANGMGDSATPEQVCAARDHFRGLNQREDAARPGYCSRNGVSEPDPPWAGGDGGFQGFPPLVCSASGRPLCYECGSPDDAVGDLRPFQNGKRICESCCDELAQKHRDQGEQATVVWLETSAHPITDLYSALGRPYTPALPAGMTEGDVRQFLERYGEVTKGHGGRWWVESGPFFHAVVALERTSAGFRWIVECPIINEDAYDECVGDGPDLAEAMDAAVTRWRELVAESDPSR